MATNGTVQASDSSAPNFCLSEKVCTVLKGFFQDDKDRFTLHMSYVPGVINCPRPIEEWKWDESVLLGHGTCGGRPAGAPHVVATLTWSRCETIVPSLTCLLNSSNGANLAVLLALWKGIKGTQRCEVPNDKHLKQVLCLWGCLIPLTLRPAAWCHGHWPAAASAARMQMTNWYQGIQAHPSPSHHPDMYNKLTTSTTSSY